MKVSQRWGEVTIKKLGEDNKFDSSKSFSIQNTVNELSILQIKDLFEIVVNLSEKFNFEQLKKIFIYMSQSNGERKI